MTFKRLLLFLVSFLLLTVLFSCGRKNEKPNVLLITIDTLRNDHVGAYGYSLQTTPFIDQLAQEGILFKQVVVPQPQTSGSHASILTSLHPLTHGLIFNALPLKEHIQSIAEVFRENGYYTIGTISTRILSSKFGFSQGFDSFSDSWDPDPEHKNLKGQRVARRVNEALFKQIQEYSRNSNKKKKPFFIWVHYYDPHEPYIGRKEITFRNPLPSHDKKYSQMIEDYDREIRYTDKAIQDVFEFLEKEGLEKDLVSCITSDHGEEFGEHSYRHGHNDFYRETTHVPLIFHGYKVPKSRTIDTYVSTMDVGVTLLGAANLRFSYPTEGVNLLKSLNQDRNKKTDNRKFLLINSQRWARSLQLIDSPYSFILNLDGHYHSWYLNFSPNAPTVPISNSRFKPFVQSQFQQQKGHTIYAPPSNKAKGLHYLVIRIDVKNSTLAKKRIPLSFKIETYPYFFTDIQQITIPYSKNSDKRPQTLEVIYPCTIVDKLKVHVMQPEQAGSVFLSNPRYAIVPKQELSSHLPGKQDSPNQFRKRIVNTVWKRFLTKRMNTKIDELFDLSNDPAMKSNLCNSDALTSRIVKMKKLLYKSFQYYLKKGKKLQKVGNSDHQMSEEDKEMLKSLGYL